MIDVPFSFPSVPLFSRPLGVCFFNTAFLRKNTTDTLVGGTKENQVLCVSFDPTQLLNR